MLTTDNEPVVQYLLAGHTQQLQVMKNETMIWAAQLPHVPVAMTTSNFKCVLYKMFIVVTV